MRFGQVNSRTYRSATIWSNAWTDASALEYRPLTHDDDRVPRCWSSQTCQSWELVRSQNAISAEGSKSWAAIVDASNSQSQITVVRSGATGTSRWTSR